MPVKKKNTHTELFQFLVAIITLKRTEEKQEKRI